MNVKNIYRLLEEKPDLLIRQTVLDTARKKDQIVYGARAINVQVPYHLKKSTTDYDVLTNKPKKIAKQIAEELNRRSCNKEFIVEKAKHPGTYKVKYKGKTVIDYTQLKGKPKTKKVFGTRYKDIKSIKKSTQRLVKKPSAEFRREKDIGTLNRIEELERIDRMF